MEGVEDADAMDHGAMDHASTAADAAGADHGHGADGARSKLTEAGRYRITVASEAEPIEINAMHAWTVRVETPDGEPVEGAALAIDGGMPEHDHGLPTAPRVTSEPATGEYRVEGFRFQMPGRWTVTFEVSEGQGGPSDSATFELEL